ncbi:hypothetical protein KSP40_PGU002347 [Platanthera guangdongensis]|uniref:Uncharacterized protein n=1 Tax=Platanthera guangdongensis TaxID=2320717 RepID=A0ABR2LI15_9ASPA
MIVVFKKRWVLFIRRDLSFLILPESSDFVSWRNLPDADFDSSNRLNHAGDVVELSVNCSKRRKDSQGVCLVLHNHFGLVLRDASFGATLEKYQEKLQVNGIRLL